MSDASAPIEAPLDAERPGTQGGDAARPLPRLAQYAAALLFVALAAGFAFTVQDRVGAANLTLIFVLPVIGAATLFGWGPSLFATVAGVLAFDFFFTEPKYSLVIASQSDLWAAALLLVIATLVSGSAAESRRRRLAAERSAEQARALQSLAHAVVHAASDQEILVAAAGALAHVFAAPSVIFMDEGGEFRPVASAGGAEVTPAEEEAAKGVRSSRLKIRAEAYPYVASEFDFWSVASPGDCRCVLGVSFGNSGRPAAAEGFVEIIGAYLAAALARPAGARVHAAP